MRKPVLISKKKNESNDGVSKSKPIVLNDTYLTHDSSLFNEPLDLKNVSDNIKYTKSIYDSAQELLIKEQKVDNDKYMKCILKHL